MSVSCDIRLSDTARVIHVADVLGILVGLPIENLSYSHRKKDGTYKVVRGVSVEAIGTVGMVRIMLRGKQIGAPHDEDGGNVDLRSVNYHFESSHGGRLLMPRSISLWIAVGRRLVDVFGGQVDYRDNDSNDFDYEVPAKSLEENAAEDGEAYDRLQERIYSVKPLTEKETKAWIDVSAYGC